MNAMLPVPVSGAELYRTSTDAASLCREIVTRTAMTIGEGPNKRKYVRVEAWQAIAIAHGCIASSRDVVHVEGGVSAIGEIRRMSDGALIAQAEGFVGEDEPVWYGGVVRAWKWGQQRGEKLWYDKTLPKRPEYAIRAMAQTRAISRACRSAFAHVVVLIDSNLETTPAEEVDLSETWEDAPGAVAPEEPRDQGKHVEPQPPTLAQRADKFERTIKALKTKAEVEKAYGLAGRLLADLEANDLERLTRLNGAYGRRCAALDKETQP
jgi:hypothetical protein